MNWPTIRISEVSQIISGATPKTSEPDYWDGEIDWVTPADLSNIEGAYIFETPRKISNAGLQSCSATVLPANSVLFSSRAPIGHVAINTAPMATNQGFKSFIPDRKRLEPKFLYWWLKAHRRQLEAMGNGATFKEVSKAAVARVEIPLPPLGEQKRITAILDKADQFRQKRRQAIALLDSLTQSIFLEMFGDAASKAWPSVELKDAVRRGTIVTYGIVQAGDEFDGGVPYIRTGDIQGGSIVSTGLRHTRPEIAAKFARSRVDTGDIVMSIRATVGTTALVPPELDGANLTQGTARIAPGKDFTSEYLLHYLRSDPVQNWIQRQVKGATFREITLSRLRELMVVVPPLPLQMEFSDVILKLQRATLRTEGSLSEMESLFASLQHRAFAGQL